MAKKEFFCIVDTETTNDDLVADFAAVICDRKGKIYAQCGILVAGIFTERNNHPLFYDYNSPIDSLWNQSNLDRRYTNYARMVESGARMVASAGAINRWLDKAVASFNPYLTAYNLPFDANKCANTGIDLTRFSNRFCLWAAAADRFAYTKAYKNFVLSTHGFNNPTAKGNMTYKANAEIMARFVLGNPDLADEPHTALEDIIFYELPILTATVKRKKIKDFIGLSSPAWQSMQVKDHFTSK